MKRNAWSVAIVALLLACSRSPTPAGSDDATTQARETVAPSAVVIPPGWKTRLKVEGAAPQPWESFTPDSSTVEVTYRSDGRELKAWLQEPQPAGDKPRPALLCLHGGFALAREDLDMCRPFFDAGFVVLSPTYRGENGNAGSFEMWVGEVDDAIAAARWLASRPGVDAQRVYAFGHSAGGAIAALMTMADDPVVAHTAGAGGLFDASYFDQSDAVPFVDSREERAARVLFGRVSTMKVDHYAYVGVEDGYGHAARAVAKEPSERLHLDRVEGDHFSSLPEAVARYLAVVQASSR